MPTNLTRSRWNGLHVDDNLHFGQRTVDIVDREVKRTVEAKTNPIRQEKYGSKNRVLAGFGIGGKSGKEKDILDKQSPEALRISTWAILG
ncbi:hypothetical protein Tco_0864343 [Tanacetum coccineum]